ncbi:hypothetical protein FPV67DRAFT_1511207 [Lyophyllum atratum]|nr:hypothetical protein FPV67DRAFT_1511207 [Lyophyllum atratum]
MNPNTTENKTSTAGARVDPAHAATNTASTTTGQGGTATGQGGTAPGQGGTTEGQGGTTPGQAGATPGQVGTKDKIKYISDGSTAYLGVGENIRGTALGAIDTFTQKQRSAHEEIVRRGREETEEGLAKLRGRSAPGTHGEAPGAQGQTGTAPGTTGYGATQGHDYATPATGAGMAQSGGADQGHAAQQTPGEAQPGGASHGYDSQQMPTGTMGAGQGGPYTTAGPYAGTQPGGGTAAGGHGEHWPGGFEGEKGARVPQSTGTGVGTDNPQKPLEGQPQSQGLDRQTHQSPEISGYDAQYGGGSMGRNANAGISPSHDRSTGAVGGAAGGGLAGAAAEAVHERNKGQNVGAQSHGAFGSPSQPGDVRGQGHQSNQPPGYGSEHMGAGNKPGDNLAHHHRDDAVTNLDTRPGQNDHGAIQAPTFTHSTAPSYERNEEFRNVGGVGGGGGGASGARGGETQGAGSGAGYQGDMAGGGGHAAPSNQGYDAAPPGQYPAQGQQNTFPRTGAGSTPDQRYATSAGGAPQ